MEYIIPKNIGKMANDDNKINLINEFSFTKIKNLKSICKFYYGNNFK